MEACNEALEALNSTVALLRDELQAALETADPCAAELVVYDKSLHIAAVFIVL